MAPRRRGAENGRSSSFHHMTRIVLVMTSTTDRPASGFVLPKGEGERIWIAGDTLTIKGPAEATGGSLTLVEVEAAPGEGPPPHIHIEDEALYVLEGEFEVLIGQDLHSCGPGTFAFVPRGTVHRFRCAGRSAGRILAFFAPGGMDGFFREAGRPVTGDGPPPPVDEGEIARTQAAGERYGLKVVSWEERGPDPSEA
jgi:quercetin dioxygenase-like cupin family protein